MLRARLILTGLWWLWGMVLLILLATLSTRIDAIQAWGWFLPNILPILTLVGTAAYAGVQAASKRALNTRVRTPLLVLSILVSATYLTMLTVAVISPLHSGDPLALMLTSNLWLTPMQALVLTALGAFFVRQERE